MSVSSRDNELSGTTVKFLNFRTPEILAVSYLKFRQSGQNLRSFCQNGAKGIANSEDPDQTAPLGVITVIIVVKMHQISLTDL